MIEISKLLDLNFLVKANLSNVPFFFDIPCIIVFLQDLWIGVAHHICGEHVWGTSQCSHDPATDKEDSSKVPLDKDSP